MSAVVTVALPHGYIVLVRAKLINDPNLGLIVEGIVSEGKTVDINGPRSFIPGEIRKWGIKAYKEVESGSYEAWV
jgi:hypothetical protein